MKKISFILMLFICLSLCSCGIFVDTNTPKSAELSEKYNFYSNSVSNIRTGANVTPEEADEIFIVLVENCGVDSQITSVSRTVNGPCTVKYGFNSLTMYLEDSNVSTVFDGEEQIYPVTASPTEEPTEEPTTTPNPTKKPKSTKKPRKKSIGKSDKDISDLDDNFNPQDMHEDVTGNFRKVEIADTSFIPQEYALSYYKNCFKDDKEVHYIVNFSTMTTTCITCVFDMLDVTVTEYEDKEQFSAKSIGGGMVLEQYMVYLDNGDIEKVKN